MDTHLALAKDQHGSISRAQALATGLTRSALRSKIRHDELIVVTHRVLRVAGTPRTMKQELMEAALDAGSTAAIATEAGAAVWGVPGFFPGVIEVLRERGAERGVPHLGELHETRVWPPSHRTVVDSIPVTTPCRTIFDLAGSPSLNEARVEGALEWVLKQTPSALESLRRMFPVMATRGRPGIDLMRHLLDERPPGYIPAESSFELRVIHILEDHGMRVRRQLNLGDDEAWIGRADLRVIDEPVVVEVDSAEHHSSKSDKERDARRDAAMARIGLHVVRINETEAFHMPWLVPIKVQDGIKEGRRLYRPQKCAPQGAFPDPIR